MNRKAFIEATGIDTYLMLLGRLVNANRPYQYTYMPSAQYQALNDPQERMRVYWFEILERARCSAIAALLRLERWLAAMSLTAESENFIAFAASFRGLLESAADTRFALGDVPKALAATFSYAHDAVWGKSRMMVLAPDLENDLIHFSHGRKLKKTESAPESHAAKTMREYLDSLQGASSGPLHVCYEELCNITHPAADSVLYLLEKRNNGSLAFAKRPDEQAISDLCTRGSTVVTFCVSESLIYPAVILRVINRFGLPELRTAAAEDVPLEHVPLWRDLESQLVARGEGLVH